MKEDRGKENGFAQRCQGRHASPPIRALFELFSPPTHSAHRRSTTLSLQHQSPCVHARMRSGFFWATPSRCFLHLSFSRFTFPLWLPCCLLCRLFSLVRDLSQRVDPWRRNKNETIAATAAATGSVTPPARSLYFGKSCITRGARLVRWLSHKPIDIQQNPQRRTS